MKQSWLLPPDYVDDFLFFCAKAATNDEVFSAFRQHGQVGCIIENSNEEWAKRSWAKLSETHLSLLHKKFVTSDSYGKPQMVDLGANVQLSPTTVRYVYILHLIEKLIGNLTNQTIVEIGAGYGGQCKIIKDVYQVKDYVVYDLPEVQALQKKYLSKFGIECTFKDGIQEIENCDLLISWCAWAELNLETKKDYFDKVISKAKRFLICSNWSREQEDLDILRQSFPNVETYQCPDGLYTNVLYST